MPHNVKVTILGVTKGECSQGFKAGDTWLIDKSQTPAGMCAGAYNSCYAAIRGFRFGAEQPWDEDKDVTVVSCPDPEHWVLYEVRRIRDE